MRRIRALIIPFLLGGYFLSGVGLAQTDLSIRSLEVAIWPEYDRPSALVIYQVRLEEDIDLPAVVSLPIPARVGDPHAVAAWNPDGSLDDSIPWTITTQGELNLVEITTDANGVWLEFYDELTFQGEGRGYTYTWPGGVVIDSLSFEILHPVGADDLVISPQGQTSVATDGLTYSRLELGARAPDESISIDLSYSKSSVLQPEPPGLRDNPLLTRFEVALWPEYDQPATLILYRGTLNPGTPLPASVSIPIPASVGDPTAVAVLGNDNRLYIADYQRQVEGDWSWITFETDTPIFQLEYYDQLAFDDTRRTYSFPWPGAVETELFAYEVQQPLGASAFQVTPGGITQPDSNGLTYTRGILGPQAIGTSLTINLQYEKRNDGLTADAVTTAPNFDRPTTTQGGTPDLRDLLPYFLAGFGILLVALGTLLYLRIQREKKPTGKRPRPRRRKPKSASQGGDLDAAVIFCHICGTKASTSDHFCRSCGTKLRQ
jgi:hypothetical protein